MNKGCEDKQIGNRSILGTGILMEWRSDQDSQEAELRMPNIPARRDRYKEISQRKDQNNCE